MQVGVVWQQTLLIMGNTHEITGQNVISYLMSQTLSFTGEIHNSSWKLAAMAYKIKLLFSDEQVVFLSLISPTHTLRMQWYSGPRYALV